MGVAVGGPEPLMTRKRMKKKLIFQCLDFGTTSCVFGPVDAKVFDPSKTPDPATPLFNLPSLGALPFSGFTRVKLTK